MTDKITIEELKMFIGTGLRYRYNGNVVKTDPEQPDSNQFFESNLTPCVKSGTLKVLKFTKSDIYYGIGQSLMNYKSFHRTEEFMPIVRPLSRLTEEIEVDGERFVPLIALRFAKADVLRTQEEEKRNLESFIKNIHKSRVQLCIVQKLASWHFDLFNWLGRGLAVEKED